MVILLVMGVGLSEGMPQKEVGPISKRDTFNLFIININFHHNINSAYHTYVSDIGIYRWLPICHGTDGSSAFRRYALREVPKMAYNATVHSFVYQVILLVAFLIWSPDIINISKIFKQKLLCSHY